MVMNAGLYTHSNVSRNNQWAGAQRDWCKCYVRVRCCSSCNILFMISHYIVRHDHAKDLYSWHSAHIWCMMLCKGYSISWFLCAWGSRFWTRDTREHRNENKSLKFRGETQDDLGCDNEIQMSDCKIGKSWEFAISNFRECQLHVTVDQ